MFMKKLNISIIFFAVMMGCNLMVNAAECLSITNDNPKDSGIEWKTLVTLDRTKGHVDEPITIRSGEVLERVWPASFINQPYFMYLADDGDSIEVLVYDVKDGYPMVVSFIMRYSSPALGKSYMKRYRVEYPGRNITFSSLERMLLSVSEKKNAI
jgi:hypothetical protein